MTTALEHALQLEQEKFAAENGGEQNLTPMQQGYMDAMAKLGYAVKTAEPPVAPATASGKGYAAALKGKRLGKDAPPVAPLGKRKEGPRLGALAGHQGGRVPATR